MPTKLNFMTLSKFSAALVFALMSASASQASPVSQCQTLFATSPSGASLKQSIYARATERAEQVRDREEPLAERTRVNAATELELRQAIQETKEQIVLNGGNLKVALLLAQQKLALSKAQTYKLFALFKEKSLRTLARNVYRPILMQGRHAMKELGLFWRAYMVRHSMDLAWIRWSWVEGLHEKGKDESSYGSTATKGLVTVLSKIASPSDKQIQLFREKTRDIGRDLVLPSGERVEIQPYKLSPMIGLSGMSYPQLSANAILSLLYMHIKLAKDGIRYTYNTGEGGPSFHMALLDPKASKEELTSAVTRYAIDAGLMKPGTLRQAEVERSVERIMEDRDTLFKNFTPEDFAKAQIIGQLGPALNGARADGNRLDLKVLERWAQKPYYAGTQFKLKQAAKKGAKVNANKVGPMTAFLRKIQPGKSVEAPELSVEWQDVESLATAIVATKLVTKKPVSIKFGVGQASEVYDMLKYLRDADALPDHVQLDGSGFVRLPGSGNAPVMDNTSLNITTATLVLDATMKKLGIREKIYLEATGDIITPSEALMNLSLGADGVAAARLWMGMGLGCALVMKCATGACYYGIANGDGKLFSEGLDPKVIGPKGAKAASYWFESFSRLYLESGADGTKPFREQQGIGNRYSTVKVRGDFSLHALSEIFPAEEVERALEGRMTLEEIKRYSYASQASPEPTAEGQALRAVSDELMAGE